MKISVGCENSSFDFREFCCSEPILKINRRIYGKNLVEILGPMVPPLVVFTWNVPEAKFFTVSVNR